MPDEDPVDQAEPHLIEEARTLDAIREHVAPGRRGLANWETDPQAIARSLLSQLAPRDRPQAPVVPFPTPEHPPVNRRAR